MIRYLLGCDAGHDFEAWFGSIASFEQQADKGLVTCPHCGSTSVERRPMAPAVVTRRAAPAPANTPTNDGTSQVTTLPTEALRELRAKIISETTDVGDKFAEEARRMHFGETDTRPIRGEATSDDVKGLVEDDIPFGMVPRLPEDSN